MKHYTLVEYRGWAQTHCSTTDWPGDTEGVSIELPVAAKRNPSAPPRPDSLSTHLKGEGDG